MSLRDKIILIRVATSRNAFSKAIALDSFRNLEATLDSQNIEMFVRTKEGVRNKKELDTAPEGKFLGEGVLNDEHVFLYASLLPLYYQTHS